VNDAHNITTRGLEPSRFVVAVRNGFVVRCGERCGFYSVERVVRLNNPIRTSHHGPVVYGYPAQNVIEKTGNCILAGRLIDDAGYASRGEHYRGIVICPGCDCGCPLLLRNGPPMYIVGECQCLVFGILLRQKVACWIIGVDPGTGRRRGARSNVCCSSHVRIAHRTLSTEHVVLDPGDMTESIRDGL